MPNTASRRVIGLVPAAGEARRLGHLPCSKEILPVGLADTADGPRVRVACEALFDGFRRAGIDRALMILRRGKWDVPAHLGDGRRLGVRLAYLAIEPTGSVPETLDHAWPFVEDADVALGFPDTSFEPRDAYTHLLERLWHGEPRPEVVLGCVPTDRSEKTDMVETDGSGPDGGGRVRRIVVKERDTGLSHAWMIAVWRPLFSRFLHQYLAERPAAAGADELYPGHVLQAAIDDGLRVDAVVFPAGRFLDVGTPGDLRRALQESRFPSASLSLPKCYPESPP